MQFVPNLDVGHQFADVSVEHVLEHLQAVLSAHLEHPAEVSFELLGNYFENAVFHEDFEHVDYFVFFYGIFEKNELVAHSVRLVYGVCLIYFVLLLGLNWASALLDFRAAQLISGVHAEAIVTVLVLASLAQLILILSDFGDQILLLFSVL